MLIKVVDRTGDFGFCFAVTDRNGRAMNDLVTHTVSPELKIRKENPAVYRVLDYNGNYLASCSGELFSGRASLRLISDLPGAVYTLEQSGQVIASSKDGKFNVELKPGKLEILCQAPGKTLKGTLDVFSREQLRHEIAEGKKEIKRLNWIAADAEAEAEKLSGELKTARNRKKALLRKIEEMYAAQRGESARKIGAAGKSEDKPLPPGFRQKTFLFAQRSRLAVCQNRQ